MLDEQVRVRFAPSPTGGLHLGGVRTVLFNYLFARQHNGKFILRIEDTDQKRFVIGAEAYILECLNWCGLTPDESIENPGAYGPYRQSERKDIYGEYARKLVEDGKAYHAFDTPEELEAMREMLKDAGSGSLMYDHHVRHKMKNSLNLSPAQTAEMIAGGTPYVIRIKVNPGEDIIMNDIIRGAVHFHSDNVDDKVLLKADGMPTYHLAVVVDDFLMKITHAFRGEEWLPSAPVHVLLWKYLFGLDAMPAWAHLPLILKPDGHGKLSKRDGDRLGFPVYAMDWKDPITGEITKGFKELGFIPQAFLNLLAVLGWNDGTEQEIYTLDEMIEKFSLDRVHTTGAKFDFEKAKWFNHEWIKKLSGEELLPLVEPFLQPGITSNHPRELVLKVIGMVKDRCTLLTDFAVQSLFFFERPATLDTQSIGPKWNREKFDFFNEFSNYLDSHKDIDASQMETTFKEMAAAAAIKAGELLLPLRIMLVGGKFGPGVFEIASTIGTEETSSRIQEALKILNS